MELTIFEVKDALNLTCREMEEVLSSLKKNDNAPLVIDNSLVYTTKCVLPIGNLIVNGSLLYLGYLIIDDQVCNKFMLSRHLPKADTTYNVPKDIADGVDAIVNTRLLQMLHITLKAI